MLLFIRFVWSLWLLALSNSDEPFDCWSKSQQTVLRYKNNGNVISDNDLPKVRLIQGYWPSQWAIQSVAYLYLKKMGVNVEFVPKLNSNESFEDLKYSYPEKYWRLIEDDEYDLLFEQWEQVRFEHYYNRRKVIHGGINGIFGEIGLFVPGYVSAEMPHAILLAQLRNNVTLRQQFIDSYTKNSKSGRDWVKYWRYMLLNDTDLLLKYQSYGYELPTYDKPIIWGSLFDYTMSQYTKNVTMFAKIPTQKGSEIGLGWTFVALGSESLLSQLVIDLYSVKQPFIANIYAPHKDFVTVSELSSEQMTFQHIALERNADNNRGSKCYLKDYNCREPLQPLFKLANPKLVTRYPEMISYVNGFVMHGDELNEILRLHEKTVSLGHGEQNNVYWLKAACIWLREHEEEFSKRFADVNIVRYQYKQFSMKDESMLSFVTCIGLSDIIIIFNFAAILIKIWKRADINCVEMMVCFNIGIILVCFGTIFLVIQPRDFPWNLNYGIMCDVTAYCYGFGAVLAITSLLLKAYNVRKAIDEPEHNQSVKLRFYLLIAMIIESFICFCYRILHKNGSFVQTDEYFRIEYHCNAEASRIFLLVHCGYIVILMVLLSFFTFRNRNIGIDLFVDGKYLFWGSIMFCLLLFFMAVICYNLIHDILYLTNIQCGVVGIGSIIIWSIFDLKPIYKVTCNDWESSRANRSNDSSSNTNAGQTNSSALQTATFGSYGFSHLNSNEQQPDEHDDNGEDKQTNSMFSNDNHI